MKVLYGSTGGSSSGGCKSKALDELTENGRLRIDVPIAQEIKADSFEKSLNDERVIQAISAWSKCMSTHGFHFTSPLDALSKANISTAAPSKSELLTAEDDYHCKISTGLISKWQSAEASIEDKGIENDIQALSREKSGMNRILVASRAVIAAHGN